MFITTTHGALRRRPLFALAVAVALVAFLAGVPAAVAATITVTITGVHSAKGDVYVALFDGPQHFPDGDYALRHLKVKASMAPIVVTFDHVPAGAYAVGCYHDENSNHKFDTNWIGYPIEGYALSNGIRAVIARPTFAEAAFTVAAPATDVALNVRY